MENEQVRYEIYQITVLGHLSSDWSEWFDGLAIVQTSTGETILYGPLADQAALHGVLIKVRDLGLPLLSLRRIEAERPDLLR